MNKFFNGHNHTDASNLRLLDCICKPKDLIDRAIELGLEGIAITDHESLSNHMQVNQYAKKIKETNPDFTIALGNEIYLIDERHPKQKYYHFILIAKDEVGYRALKELSSIAWYNCYSDFMERVPLLKKELKEKYDLFKGHLIATTACLGGELPSLILGKQYAIDNEEDSSIYDQKINEFLDFCLQMFGDDFYLECAPAASEEQIFVNKKLLEIAKEKKIKMIPATDTHYLSKEDRFIHKAYLNSRNEEREVDDFYEFARLMDSNEVEELLGLCFNEEEIKWLMGNTIKMKNSIKFFSLERKQQIPEVDVTNYPKEEKPNNYEYKVLKELYKSDNIQERYWVNECEKALKEKGLDNNKEYWERLEEEARVKKVIGEKLETCMFAYPNTLKHYVDTFWECGSTVGAGRGSACAALNHYLLGITQLDPVQWGLPFWRYLNDERTEIGDVDVDLAPSKLPRILDRIREERGELGIIQVCTFGTESTKSAILTACRGYRSEEYPNGIDNDEAQYLSSLVQVERGAIWSIHDMIHGNAEKGRKPQTIFINAVGQYPGLLKIIEGIEGLICRRGSHASGVIFFDENIFDTAAIMRTPSGALVTQWDLHAQEAAGSTKYDFLLTTVQDIIIKTIELLQEADIFEKDLSLREIYNKYLHPSVLPVDDEKMWKALENNEVINCFQFDSSVGAQAAKKIKPRTPQEMSDANGLMRLMTGEPGGENPIDKYVRFKNNIKLWYKEMDEAGLTKEEQKVLERYFLESYGVPPSQEQMMKMLMDEDICNFTLGEANAARKIVGKKLVTKIPDLHKKILLQAKSPSLGEYVWKCGIGPQVGYSFSTIHALAYSFVGMQTLYLATHFNPIYWNTACLIANSGSIDDTNYTEEIVNIYEPEKDDIKNGIIFEDLPDRSGKIKKTPTTDYAKMASAIGAMKDRNINVSLIDINTSNLTFSPDVENNRIVHGLRGLLNVGEDVINEVIKNRPYSSIKDFLNKNSIKKQSMISLIKAGGFDSLHDRKFAMAYYIWSVCDKKKRITLQNMGGLIKYGLIPPHLELEKRVYEFTRFLKSKCKKSATQYLLPERAINFLIEINQEGLITDDYLAASDWDKVYQSYMDNVREWIRENQDEILDSLNKKIFKEDWLKYADGSVSRWEMEVVCFYDHEHELINVNREKYGLVNFNELPEEPEIERSFTKGNKTINMFKLHRICGTCIAKNKPRSSISLLTTSGVVEVKFRKEYFAMFDKRISQVQPDGTKKIVEKSWFDRGSLLVVQGVRNGDTFLTKNYKSSNGHQLYKIDAVETDGNILLRSERFVGNEEI